MIATSLLNPVTTVTSFDELLFELQGADRFNHVVIDNFLTNYVAEAVLKEFTAFDRPIWNEYNNAIEVKKACNHGDRFPRATYQLFSYLNSKGVY
jgi:trehalose/maltose hydrolase-like predicted phosphorylase